MRKAIFTALATVFAIAAVAQNPAIDAIAENYADREGVTVFNMEGEAIKNLSQMAAGGSGTISVSEGKTVDISELLDEIVSVTAIVVREANEMFSADVRSALEVVRYTPVVSHNDGETRVRIVSADIRRGRLRGNKEIVATVDNGKQTMLVRLIGKIDTDLLAELATVAAR